MKKIITASLLGIAFLGHAQLKPVAYTDGKQKLNGFSIAPARPRGNEAGILILPAWKGIDDHSKDVAGKLSKLGYYVFIADIYGEGHYPNDNQEAGKEAGFYKKNYEDYQRRIRLALDELVNSGANKSNLAIIGYCFGGTGALEAARAGLPVKGVISFHGGLGKDPSRKNGPIHAKVLALHGADDPTMSAGDIAAFQKEMRDGNADWQMTYFGNAVHAFTDPSAGNDNSKGAAYNELADQRSWRQAVAFLREILP
jgi:dienelactone hydrolase